MFSSPKTVYLSLQILETILLAFLLTQVLYYTKKMLCKRTLPRALTVTNKKTTWLRVTVPDEQFGSEPD